MYNLLLSPPFAARDSLQTVLKHKAASFVPSPCLIGLGRVGEQASGGGTSPCKATKGPCDITLPPAVMSEATTMDFPRQMAGMWGEGEEKQGRKGGELRDRGRGEGDRARPYSPCVSQGRAKCIETCARAGSGR